MILAYLDNLEHALRFDRALARRVRQEAEAHLLEAIAVDPAADKSEAERKAIAGFGDPKAIAAQFAGLSLVRQVRGITGTVIVIVFGIFVAMKIRVEWYALTHWTMPADRKSIADLVLSIDRYAFWTSVFLGTAVYLYVSSRRVLAGSPQSVRRVYILCGMTTGTLAVSVGGDGLLTALQLHGAQLCSVSIPPVLSWLFEISAVSILGLRVLILMKRARSTTRLFTP